MALLACLVYLPSLGRITRPSFDEKVYVYDALQMANGTWEVRCSTDPAHLGWPLNYEHPPLAKEILAASIRLFEKVRIPPPRCSDGPDSAPLNDTAAFVQAMRRGGNPAAWRAPGALLAAAAVGCTAFVAGRLLRSRAAAVLAGGLLLVDGVAFAMARIAMLDVYAMAFALGAAACATFPTARGRTAAAVLLALAIASKLTALLAAGPVLAVGLWSHHRAGRLDGASLRHGLASLLAWVPALHLTAYLPWWRLWIPRYGLLGAIRHWWAAERGGLAWAAAAGSADAAGASPAWTWLALRRPVELVAVFNVGNRRGHDAFVYTIGNPFLWWGAAAAALVLLGLAARRAWRGQGPWRDRLARLAQWRHAPVAAAAALWLLAYAPFLLLRRATFLYYMEAVVPWMAIAAAGAALALWRQGGWRAAVAAAWLAAALLAFAVLFPLLAGLDVTLQQRDAVFALVPWMRH